MAAEELADGDGAIVVAFAEAEDDGAAAGAEELDVPAEPPQAVRLSRAAAATPATLKVVRLMVCIVVLLGLNMSPGRERDVRGADCFRLVGTCLGWCLSGYSAAAETWMGRRQGLFQRTGDSREYPGAY
jgi:hypothetical protein